MSLAEIHPDAATCKAYVCSVGAARQPRGLLGRLPEKMLLLLSLLLLFHCVVVVSLLNREYR